jgi:hypothetical protein
MKKIGGILKFINNPLLQFAVGFFLMMYGLNKRSGNQLIDYAWLIMAIFGMAILGNAARKLRKTF